MSDITLEQVRTMNDVVEAVHAIVYFAPEVQQRYEDFGMEPRGEGYVAGRAAPLGAVGPATAAATFFNFNPALFHHALPGAWDKADPVTVLDARSAGLQELFTRVEAPTDGLDEIVELVTAATSRMTWHGRPLAAANASVALPDGPYSRAWQALAVLREHRGDGHVALLTAAGLDPVETLVMMVGWEGSSLSRRFLQKSRLWSDEDWDGAIERLVARGLTTDDSELTAEGADLREQIEVNTDRLAAEPYQRMGDGGLQRLFDLVRPLAVALDEGEAYPRPLTIPDALPA